MASAGTKRRAEADAADGSRFKSSNSPLTPRMHKRLAISAGQCADMCRDNIADAGFQKFKPLDSTDVHMLGSAFRYVPRHLRREVYKSFAGGFQNCMEAISEVLKDGKLPTANTVLGELTRNRYSRYNNVYVNFYLSKGGKIEYAIDAVIGCAQDEEDDGEFEEAHGDSEEWTCLPEHKGDADFDGARDALLPPPFVSAYGNDYGDDDSEDDEDDYDEDDEDDDDDEDEDEDGSSRAAMVNAFLAGYYNPGQPGNRFTGASGHR